MSFGGCCMNRFRTCGSGSYLLALFLITAPLASAQDGKKVDHQWTPIKLQIQKPGPSGEDLLRPGEDLLRHSNGTQVEALLHLPTRFLAGFDADQSKVAIADDKNNDLLQPFGLPVVAGKVTNTGKYAQITFRARSCPAGGAAKIRIKGDVAVLVGTNEKTVERKDVSLKNGVDLGIGTLTAPEKISGARFQGSRPIKNAVFLDDTGAQIHYRQNNYSPAKSDFVTSFLWEKKGKVDRCDIRITYFETVERIVVPVNLEVGVGF